MSSLNTNFPANWVLPRFDAHVFGEKRHRDVLIIPVINEGARIQKQLKELHAFNFPVDVIIADGGSTDGSLNPDFLANNGVRALLTKREGGKLSTQLRMAYAVALQEGYEGILTVDGNGKDGLDAVPLFLEKLHQGYDLVQGSRYVAGGVAENTPLDRKLAGKFLHAPIISWGAKFRYTDTTNGFRGYSATALLDPKVAPFRSIFSTYTLLFYLSVRIPQLGYKAIEVPVRRTYPVGEKTPTKISGVQGRIDMIKELVDAARGRFNP
jgi:dolichol-phosphate mannosyltransferase